MKKYRMKTEIVTALKTYEGQPLHEIRDFMIGCKNIHLSLVNLHRGFNEDIKGDGVPTLMPGDYIVKDSNRNAIFVNSKEFEERYEEKVSFTELHYVIQKYGFQVVDAEYMLRDEKLRAILLAPLITESKKSKRTQTVIINNEKATDSAELVKEKIAKHLDTV